MKELKNKFWFNLFWKIGIIFVVFVLVLAVCNTAFLSKYYEFEKESELIKAGNLLKTVDLDNSTEAVEQISQVQELYGFDVEIYNSSGKILYSTFRGAMMDYIFGGNSNFSMTHTPLEVTESKEVSAGGVMQKGVSTRDSTEYLLYKFSLENGVTAELRIQVAYILNSAKIANRFIIIVAAVVLFFALLWVLWFARKISKPITKMNLVTGKMAQLDFTEKLYITEDDEIGELAKSVNTLSSKLDETLKDLRVTNAKLKDEIELERSLDIMRKSFVADVSHELKTPIAIIRGYAEGLKLDINSLSRDKYCDIIMDESDRMNKLVLSLLDLSKYESGGVPLNLSHFPICDMIKGMTARIVGDKDINVVYSMPENLVAVADPDRIEQVIKSYLENAVSHINKGGTLSVAVEEEKNGLKVSVHNTGSNVEEEMMSKIWQSFYRGDKSHNRNSNRFGLGLSIVSAIIKLHNKECGVYNTDTGVCFWFTLDKVS